MRVVGCEPVAEMRAVGHSRGLSPDELVDGNIMALNFPDKSFDCVGEFAVLHHVRDPIRAVDEMIRVAKKAVFVSDSNCLGSGSRISRVFKRAVYSAECGLLLIYVKSSGKRHYVSEGDGLFYSYSTVFQLPTTTTCFQSCTCTKYQRHRC